MPRPRYKHRQVPWRSSLPWPAPKTCLRPRNVRFYGRVYARNVGCFPQNDDPIWGEQLSHDVSSYSNTVLSQDFSTDNAFKYLKRYRNIYSVFNDDIQGTGAVVLSGLLNAAKLSSAASGEPLSSHRILFFGAGSAGVGVAQQLMSFFILQGLSREEARQHVWFVDSQGLVYSARGRLAEHKKCTSLDASSWNKLPTFHE
jgi:hypothetical protein